MISFRDMLEAVSLSTYREQLKASGAAEKYRDRHRREFEKFPDRDKNSFRVFLPLSDEYDKSRAAENRSRAMADVEWELARRNVRLRDYVRGTGTDKYGREVKIGKVIKDDPELLNKFANDDSRASSGDYEVVVSRHPYDVVGMSTGRGWTSCMDLEKEGCNSHYVKIDVRFGTVAVYLVKKGDRDLKNPVARILLKPFFNEDGSTALEMEKKVYGDLSNVTKMRFKNTVKEFLKKFNEDKDGIFSLSNSLYDDDLPAQTLCFVRSQKMADFFVKEYLDSKKNEDGSYNVKNIETQMGMELIKYLDFKNLNIKKVENNMSIKDLDIDSLEGCPQEVGGYFRIKQCKNLKSLKGGPKKVGANYDCTWNGLTSLEGAPEHVAGDFACDGNFLRNLVGAPKTVGGHFDANRMQTLVSLKGAPERVGKDFRVKGAPIQSLEGAPLATDSFECDTFTSDQYKEYLRAKFKTGPNKLLVENMSVREIVEHFMRKNNNDREAAAKSFASYRGWRGHDFTPEQNAKMVQVKNIFDRMNRKG